MQVGDSGWLPRPTVEELWTVLVPIDLPDSLPTYILHIIAIDDAGLLEDCGCHCELCIDCGFVVKLVYNRGLPKGC